MKKTATKKAAPKKKPVKAAPTVREWTKAEDFYITVNLGRISVANIAHDLTRENAEVVERIGVLNLTERLSQAEKDSRLKGFMTHNGVVSMTGHRSMADDASTGAQPNAVTEAVAAERKRAGLPAEPDPQPNPTNKEFKQKYGNNVHKIW